MEYIRCNQRLSPIRFAFTISLSDTDSVLSAVEYSTALWGGLGNVLVPIWKKFPSKESKRRSIGLLKDFDPDFIVNLTSIALPKEMAEEFGKRILPKSEFIKLQNSSSQFGYGLTILPLLQHIWATETKSISGKSRALQFKNITGRYRKYWSFVFGKYPDGFNANFESTFSSALKAKELKASFPNLETITTDEIITPIDLTVYQLTRLGYWSGFSSHLVYIGSPANNNDLVEFWNMRASGCEILFVPITHFKSFGKKVTKTIKAGDYPINERVQNEAEMQKGPSLKDSKFEEVCNWVRDELKHNIPRRTSLPSWGIKRQRFSRDVPCKYVDAEKTTNLIFDGEDLAPLSLICPSFFGDDKDYQDFKRHHHSKIHWVNEIDLSDDYKNEYFFDLPFDPKISDWVSRSFIFGSQDKTRLGEKGIIYYNDALMGEVNLHPLKTEEVISQMFKERGMEISPSPAGVFAKRIIEYMDGLHGCRVFKIQGVRDILIRLSKQQPRFGMTYGELKGIIGNRTTDSSGGPNWDNSIYKDLVLYYQQPMPLTPETSIEHLFKKNIFRVGLRFICQNCGKEDWYHLTEFDVNFTCRYCFKNQHIGSLEGNSKKEWHYKSDGLFMIPNAGEGSLSVILALWRLDHLVHSNSFKYITSQDIKGGKVGEIDFVVSFTNHFQMGSILVLGEARNFVDFTRKDVSKLINIGSKFTPKPYLCFATLKDKFTDKEKTEMRRVIEHGFGLIPLTRLDLDPYDLFDRFDSLKNKYAVTIEDLSANLCLINLGLSEGEVYDLTHQKEKKLFEKMRYKKTS